MAHLFLNLFLNIVVNSVGCPRVQTSGHQHVRLEGPGLETEQRCERNGIPQRARHQHYSAAARPHPAIRELAVRTESNAHAKQELHSGPFYSFISTLLPHYNMVVHSSNLVLTGLMPLPLYKTLIITLFCYNTGFLWTPKSLFFGFFFWKFQDYKESHSGEHLVTVGDALMCETAWHYNEVPV